MSSATSRAAALSGAFLLLATVAACGPEARTGDSGTGSAGSTAAPSFNVIGQPADVAAAGGPRMCSQAGPAADIPGWSGVAEGEAAIIPIIVSSLLTVGPNRFLYTLTDDAYQVLADPAVPTSVAFYALERDPASVVATVDGVYLDTGTGRGLYRASTDFDCAGEWGVEVRADLQDGTTASQRMRFQVHPAGTTPAIGDPAPRSDSLTATTIEEIRLVSTDSEPFPGAYERTVAEVVTAGQPSLVFFATPSFCQTGVCGPTVNLVKSVAADYQGRVGYVNVEPYKLHMTENGLQPELDAEGRLQPVQAVIDYGIPVEPYLFVVDAEGDVFAKFEGVVGADELRGAIEDVLAEAS
jgi:hypothetical protein